MTLALLLIAPFTGRAFRPTVIDEAFRTPEMRALVGRDDVMVVGSHDDPIAAYRALFHLASRARGRLEPEGTFVAPQSIPGDVRTLVLMPRVGLAERVPAVREAPFAVVSVP